MATSNIDPSDHLARPLEPQSATKPRPEVLIVDDDQRTLRVFRRVLLRTDRHCMTLDSAGHVAAVLRAHPSIAVVICDLRLPDSDGIELIQAIRAEFGEQRPIQFIVVSGHVSMESTISALRLEAVDFLFKPVMPRDLIASVHKALLRAQLSSAKLASRARHFDANLLRLIGRIDSSTLPDAALARQSAGASSALRDHLPHYGEEYRSLRFLQRLHETRVRLFGSALVPDPAWGILAELMRAALTGRKVAVTALCQASKVPFTTALRRIDDLIEAGLAARMPDPSDRRRSYIELTDTGHQKMQRYLRNVAVSLSRAR
jgi:CheY-like chemotaxis protein/DNA-binding MarR family transcriptional regulator